MPTAAVLDHLPRTFQDHLKAEKKPKKPHLCSNTVQVPSYELNRIEINELCKIEVCGYLRAAGFWREAESVENCGSTFVHLKDQNGHEKYARTHCNMDYCPICGKIGSKAHNKRATRAMDRLIWANVLGYMVFTLPKEVSINMPDSDTLSGLSKKAWEIVKKNFSAPGGMARVHLLGEEPESLHIHINVVFPIVMEGNKGEVPQETLSKVREEWTEYVNKVFGLCYENTNAFYKFDYQEGRKIHTVRYVLRPIVTPEKFLTLPEGDRVKVLKLRGWHNTRWFGRLANSQYRGFLRSINVKIAQKENADPALSKECPICGKKFKFVEIVQANAINRTQLRAIDNDTLVDFSIYSKLKEQNST